MRGGGRPVWVPAGRRAGPPAASQRNERFAPFWLSHWDSDRSPRRQVVPSQSPRHTTTRPSRSRPSRRSRAGPAARSRGTRRPAATPESADAPTTRCRPGQDRVHRRAVRHARPVTAQRIRRPIALLGVLAAFPVRDRWLPRSPMLSAAVVPSWSMRGGCAAVDWKCGERVDGGSAQPELEVEMWARGVTGRTDEADPGP
jgi:hypothetical protein